MSETNEGTLQTPAIPAMPPPGTKRKRPARAKGRGYRRPEEDVPGADYIERMEALGPRDGESHLAFRMRMAQIKEGRRVLIEAGRRCYGNMADACREIGISRHNLTRHLHYCGLTTKDMADFRPDAGYRG